jgi:phosphatidylcholine synthase
MTSNSNALILPRPRRGRLIVRRFLAWCVHAYTALGLVCAAGVAVAIFHGPDSFRLAFLLMFIATVIDATDGTLARLIQVKKVLPGFDGRRLDDLIDFQTYTSLPLLLIWRAGILPPEYSWCLLVPLLASAYGFSQTSAKTEDGFFLGFPSYWNLVAFYLYVLQPPPWVSLTLLWGLALLTFVPLRYLYPTQRGWVNQVSNLLAFVWGGLLVWIVWGMPPPAASGKFTDPHTRLLTFCSLVYPAYYLGMSWAISWRYWHKKRPRGRRRPRATERGQVAGDAGSPRSSSPT